MSHSGIIDEPYPEGRNARDRWIYAHRNPAQRPHLPSLKGDWRPTNVLTEIERQADGTDAVGGAVFLLNRECPWRCLMCDLWKHTVTDSVPEGAIISQLDAALEQSGQIGERGCSADGSKAGTVAGAVAREAELKAKRWEWIKLYNAGSFFDPKAVPDADYSGVAARCRSFRNVVVECHPKLVGQRTWRFQEMLGEKTGLEVAMGLETAHPEVLKQLNKGMQVADFEKAVRNLKARGCGVRAFVLIQPPFMGAADSVRWAARSVELCFALGVDVVTMIPVRLGNGALEALERQGQFSKPDVETVLEAHAEGMRMARQYGRRLFLDLWDMEQWAPTPADQERVRTQASA